MDSDGSFKLGNFSCARETRNLYSISSTHGNPEYMAPEIYANGDFSCAYSEASDLYSLGIVLYRLLNRMCSPFTDFENA